MQKEHAEHSFAEELVHAISHGAGAILSIAGLSWMLYLSIGAADPWRIVASSVYGASLIFLFLASTLYHAWPASPRKKWLKLLDHCAIYLLIAGTYTPFLLVAMRTSTGWWLFGAIWSLATAGILTKLWLRHRHEGLSLAGYLVMGWLVVIAGPQLADAIGDGGMVWVIAGGLSYTVGAFFFMAKRIPFNHAIWHFFVLAGGICHFFAVARHVLPVTPSVALVG
ncbi:MAG: PAQR family membrane homeostasis protein TrhA [Gammaproteobacteria bacterium]